LRYLWAPQFQTLRFSTQGRKGWENLRPTFVREVRHSFWAGYGLLPDARADVGTITGGEGVKQPPDRVIRAAVLRWTRAKHRWLEFALAEVGSDVYRKLLPQCGARRREELASAASLIRVGNRLLLARKKAVRAEVRQ
jgi:hypothetical protein